MFLIRLNRDVQKLTAGPKIHIRYPDANPKVISPEKILLILMSALEFNYLIHDSVP